MNCPELQELERHLAGEAGEAVSAHVESCASCATRIDEISHNLADLSGVQDGLRDEAAAAEIALPERIGPFEVLREIARGGMGVVYLARQERPRREVALKVLRPGLASADTLRRFELEAEVLARLRHPGIATVHDAGVTTLASAAAVERVPYIAMEYVRGERLDRYAETGKPSLAERLNLLAKIADAVHHAHLNGLVHRDLKPGNILVGPDGEPKILDFGIARVTDPGAGGTLRTSQGQLLGTVPYMSPEQLTADPAAIDARSDVYALGVIGYELLAGELPFGGRNVSFVEAARRIREESPPPPSRLNAGLRGDVETILLKALEKDPARRYPSAAELAADLRRFLRREPIQARPQSAAYQLRRFAQRNRGLVAVVAGLALALLAATAISAVLAVRAMRADERAREGLADARREADKLEAVNRFVEEMLGAASPEGGPENVDVTVRQALEHASARLDAGSLAEQPEIELSVRVTLGETYRALGDYPAARPQLERAVALGRELYPDGHADLATALNKLGRVDQGVGDFDAAAGRFEECLEMRRRLFGPRHEEVAVALNNLAHLEFESGDRGAAMAMHRQALEIRRERLGPVHEEIATSLNNIAVVHYVLKDYAQAEALLRESLEMDRGLRGERHPKVLSTMNNLAVVCAANGKRDEAERLQRDVVAVQRAIYGGEHPELANALQNLARFFVRGGKLDEAQPLFEEALAMDRRLRGPRHPHVAALLANYAELFEARSDWDRARRLRREALEIRREALGPDHADTLASQRALDTLEKR